MEIRETQVPLACASFRRGGGAIRIENLRVEEAPSGRSVVADVVWEDRRREPQTVWFASPDPRACLAPDPHAFLCAAAAPALAAGERRLHVEGAVSPRLRDGLTAVFRTLIHWHRPGRRLPRLECSGGFLACRPAEGAGAALMLSGGVDSLALLQANRRTFPRDHPRSYVSGFFVHGFDRDGDPREGGVHARALPILGDLAAETDLELVPVSTNVKSLGSRWAEEHQGGALAAVGHAFAAHTRSLDVASSYTWATLFPYGSHPSLDLHYATEALGIRHADLGRGRLEKLQGLGVWPAALAALRVCWEGHPPEGAVNCGRCHKCVLTLLGLVAVGCEEACTAFPVSEVTPALAEHLRETQTSSIPFYAELLEPLASRGRGDLAAVVRRKLEAVQALRARADRRPWWRLACARRGA